MAAQTSCHVFPIERQLCVETPLYDAIPPMSRIPRRGPHTATHLSGSCPARSCQLHPGPPWNISDPGPKSPTLPLPPQSAVLQHTLQSWLHVCSPGCLSAAHYPDMRGKSRSLTATAALTRLSVIIRCVQQTLVVLGDHLT